MAGAGRGPWPRPDPVNPAYINKVEQIYAVDWDRHALRVGGSAAPLAGRARRVLDARIS